MLSGQNFSIQGMNEDSSTKYESTKGLLRYKLQITLNQMKGMLQNTQYTIPCHIWNGVVES